MAEQDQQLQLIVTLVDQATPGLRQLRNELQQTGNMSAERLKSAAGDIEKHAAKIGEGTKDLTREVNASIRELGRFASSVTGLPLGEFGKVVNGATLGIGGLAVAVGGLPLIFREMSETLGQFSERMTGLKTNAEAVGLSAIQFRNLADQVHRFGFDTERSEQLVGNFVKTIERATRPGTMERLRLGQIVADPTRWIAEFERMQQMINRGEAGRALTMGAADLTREEERLRTQVHLPADRAADMVNQLAAAMGLGSDWRRLSGQTISDQINAERAEQLKRQIEAAEQHEKVMAQYDATMRNLTERLAVDVLPAFDRLVAALDKTTAFFGGETRNEKLQNWIEQERQRGKLEGAAPQIEDPNAPPETPYWGPMLRRQQGAAPQGPARFLDNAPLSSNIEDRRGENDAAIVANTLELKRLNDFLTGVSGGPGRAILPRAGYGLASIDGVKALGGTGGLAALGGAGGDLARSLGIEDIGNASKGLGDIPGGSKGLGDVPIGGPSKGLGVGDIATLKGLGDSVPIGAPPKGLGDAVATPSKGLDGGGDPAIPASGGGNAYLKALRAPFAKELANNDERLRLAAIISLENEGAGTGVSEALMNRQAGLGKSLAAGMGGGAKSFFGPVRAGLVEPRMQQLLRDPKHLARLNSLIDQTLAGSNRIQMYQDQGSAGDPNYIAGGTGVNINRERFNIWGGGRGHAWWERWRQQQLANIAAADAADRQRKTAGEFDPGPLRRHFATPGDVNREMLNRRALSEQTHRVEGSASIDVNVAAPPGTSVKAKSDGLFKPVSMSRQTQMAFAQGGPRTPAGSEFGTT